MELDFKAIFKELKPESSDNSRKRLINVSLRAPERCVAISHGKTRLLRFTRNDNLYLWIWVKLSAGRKQDIADVEHLRMILER